MNASRLRSSARRQQRNLRVLVGTPWAHREPGLRVLKRLVATGADVTTCDYTLFKRGNYRPIVAERIAAADLVLMVWHEGTTGASALLLTQLMALDRRRTGELERLACVNMATQNDPRHQRFFTWLTDSEWVEAWSPDDFDEFVASLPPPS